MNDVTVTLTIEELGEVLAKLANELEDYGSEASPALRAAFVKLWGVPRPAPIRITLLMAKWAVKLIGPKGVHHATSPH